METIGERLRRRREELGLSIEQAAEATKFRPELIEAVEKGRAGVFSAGVYRDGFIRTYAGLLKLDGDALLRDEKTEEERAHDAIRSLRARPARSPVSPKVLVGVLAVVVVGIAAVILISRAGRDSTAKDRLEAAQTGEVKSIAGGRARQAGQARRRGPGAGAPKQDSVAAAVAETVAAGESSAGPEGASTGQPAQDSGPHMPLSTQSAPRMQAGDVAQSGQTGDRSRDAPAPGGGAQVLERAGPDDETTQERLAEQRTQAANQVRPSAGPSSLEPAAQPGTATGAGSTEGTGQSRPVTGAGTAVPAAGMHTLEIVANRSSVITIKSGDRVIFNEYLLKRGARVERTDTGPFFIVALTDRHAVSITLDGKPVRLPLSDSPELFDWPLPSGR